MRVSTVAVCTLTALVIQDIHQRAIANPHPDKKSKNLEENKRIESPPVSETALVMPIAQPEPLSIEVWSQPEIIFSSNVSEGEAARAHHPASTIVGPVSLTTLPELATPEPTHTDISTDEPLSNPPEEIATLPENSANPLGHSPSSHGSPVQQTQSQNSPPLDTAILFALTPVEVLHASGSPRCPSTQSHVVSEARFAQVSESDSPQQLTSTLQATVPQVPPLEVVEEEETDIAQFESVGQPGVLPTCSPVLPPPQNEIDEVTDDLNRLEDELDFSRFWRSSPALTIQVPSGFGVDNNRVFLSGTFQEDTRYSEEADGAMSIGIGLGDADRSIGAEISYTVASFGSNRDFGVGGFNVRLHRQLTNNLSASVGWRGILTTGEVDFRDSIYGAITQIFETRDSLSKPFSRVALTAGVGNGQFRTEEDVRDGDGGVGAFGSLAIRVARPVSVITEWTGQDLAVGLSIAPFRRRNIVITPAVRDLAGGGDEARFVLGAGVIF